MLNLKIKNMRYKNILADAFAQKSNQNTNVAIGLIAGIAVGAALAVLFAPFSGKHLRKTIAENLLNDGQPNETGEEQEPQPVTTGKQKKPKSDIKELVHQAHAG